MTSGLRFKILKVSLYKVIMVYKTKFGLIGKMLFAVIAIFGGFAGAAFCQLNFYLSMWRRKHTLGHAWRKVFDVLLCVWITATLNFWMPTWVGGCHNRVANYQCNNLENFYTTCQRAGFVEPLTLQNGTHRSLSELCDPTFHWENGVHVTSVVGGKRYTFNNGKLPKCCSSYTCRDYSFYDAYSCCKDGYKYPVYGGTQEKHRCPKCVGRGSFCAERPQSKTGCKRQANGNARTYENPDGSARAPTEEEYREDELSKHHCACTHGPKTAQRTI